MGVLVVVGYPYPSTTTPIPRRASVRTPPSLSPPFDLSSLRGMIDE